MTSLAFNFIENGYTQIFFFCQQVSQPQMPSIPFSAPAAERVELIQKYISDFQYPKYYFHFLHLIICQELGRVDRPHLNQRVR